MTFMMPTMMLIMNLITLLIVWVGAKGIDAGSMQVGDMMAFIQYTMQIIMSFLMITMISICFQERAYQLLVLMKFLVQNLFLKKTIILFHLMKITKD